MSVDASATRETSGPPRTRPPLFAWFFQTLLVLALVALIAWLVSNTLAHLRERGIRAGFDFLTQPAGFEIGESWLSYESSQPFWSAFLAGLANTVRVALPGIVLATLLGTVIGLGRLSRNFLLRSISTGCVELLRNVPLLVQLLMWYFALTELLPASNDAVHVAPGIFLSKSGLSFPWWEAGGFDWPMAGELNVIGGASVTPEFLAVWMGLSTYTAAFVAETVRAGIQSVSAGQLHAAMSMGLTPRQALRYIVMPQALRVIVPSITNQYLNLTKNSSLAVAVGYPDLVSVANTALNQTGRAFECIAVIMSVYLVLSLLTSVLMNRYNARVALRGAG
ncbi:MAG: ABC transporter permease subunit [Burkholderiales bacterium]|jgi:general L-amino acid transport system permease protein|nr:ABC transporter permease subunit [Burkholderiales bacterium]